VNGLQNQLLVAHAVLAREGHDEFQFGHISGLDRNAGVMWIKRGDVGFGAAQSVDDLVAVDLAGNQVSGAGPLHSEVWLHLGLYAARPVLTSIAHSHARALVAYSAVEPAWPIIDQYSLEIGLGITWYDHSGLITNADLGAGLAAAVGTGRTCFLRSHGALVADESIEAAVVGMVQLGRAVEIQRLARSLGTPRPMPEADAETTRQFFVQNRQRRVQTMWAQLRRDVDPMERER
jgi:L-fuculose-phosphate aldolase